MVEISNVSECCSKMRCSSGVWAGLAFAVIFVGSIALMVGVTYNHRMAAKRNYEWWERSVIYHIFTPSFYDSNDDGYGDLRGKNLLLTTNTTSKVMNGEGRSLIQASLYPSIPWFAVRRPPQPLVSFIWVKRTINCGGKRLHSKGEEPPPRLLGKGYFGLERGFQS